MTDNFIQLEKNNILKLGIKDKTGKETGEFLTFDLEDPQILLNLQDLIDKDEKLWKNTRNQIIIINKRQDKKGKKLLSYNQEEKIRITIDFFKQEEEIYDLFLGKGGVKKLLNGRSFNFTTLAEIRKIILVQIKPFIEKTMDIIEEQVKKDYGIDKIEVDEVIE